MRGAGWARCRACFPYVPDVDMAAEMVVRIYFGHALTGQCATRYGSREHAGLALKRVRRPKDGWTKDRKETSRVTTVAAAGCRIRDRLAQRYLGGLLIGRSKNPQ